MTNHPRFRVRNTAIAAKIRGDREGLFKLVTLDRILNRITGVTSGCWWLVVVNAIPILDICQINQQNISSCSVINNRIKKISQLYCQLKQSLITRYFGRHFLTL
jgi:MFS-type transporter involved in bile tolerance (Atg22 family)